MLSWVSLAPIPRNQIAAILKRNPLGTRDDYVAKNELTTFICVNTWLIIINKWSPFGAISVKRAIIEHGFGNVISRASDSADELIHEKEITDSLFRSICNDVNTSVFTHPSDGRHLIGFDVLATQLCILRYPKRYTPIDSDVLYAESMNAFVENDRRLRQRQNTEFPQWLIEPMREYIYSINWDILKKFDPYEIVLSPGINLDASSKLGSKLGALAKDVPEAFISPFGIPMVGHRPSVEKVFYGRNNLYEKRVTKCICVPKSYKASRIIFPETVARQSYAKQCFNLISRVIPNEIPLMHQESNQELCRVAGFATIDWSKASDSICKSLLWELFPYHVAKFFDRCLPTHYTMNGKERLLHGLATSGNALTFILESIIFWALGKVSIDYAKLYLGTENDIISVYGDDVVLPDEAADICCQFGELLGFIPNMDKTFFGSMKYRESCGKEYYEGVDTSCVYFPRSPIEGTLNPLSLSSRLRREGWPELHNFDSTQQLIGLQHSLYPICFEAAVFVSEIIRDCHPNMTSSPANTDSFDIWAYEDTRKRRGIPTADIRHVDWRTIEIKRAQIQTDTLYRECKYGARVKYASCDRHEDNEVLLNLYNYQSFLKHGPSYETPLLELLGVSKRPISYDEAYGNQEVKWGYIDID